MARPGSRDECPTPLEELISEFTAGGMVFTPAGRWETVVETPARGKATMTLRTDHAVWTFHAGARLPYLPAWLVGQGPQVAVLETDTTMSVEVTRDRTLGRGHGLLVAIRARVLGWLIQDRPDGATPERVRTGSLGRARGEVRRRARAHADRLGLPLRPGSGGRDE